MRCGRMVGLFGNGGEGLIERHAGADQCGELSRRERQERRCEPCRFRAAAWCFRGGLDRGRKQTIAPELIAYRSRGRRLEHAAARATGDVEGLITKRWHRATYWSAISLMATYGLPSFREQLPFRRSGTPYVPDS